jgi:hypothetical protein
MIASFSPHFIKSTFDLVERPRKKKQNKRPPSLFTQFYKRVNHLDRTQIEDAFYQENQARTAVAEKLDAMKFKKKERVMNNLLYDKEITLETLSVLCTFYKCALVYLNEKTYVRMGPEGEPLFMRQNQFVDPVDLHDSLEIVLEKPLKSVSYYCLPELREMATKLLLPVEKYKKQILYDSIKQILLKLYKIEE